MDTQINFRNPHFVEHYVRQEWHEIPELSTSDNYVLFGSWSHWVIGLMSLGLMILIIISTII